MANIHNRNCIKEHWGTHKGEDAFVIGTGTSLTGFNFARLRGRLTIGLNDALKVPGLDLAFSIFCDVGVWKRYKDMTLHPRTQLVCQKRARDQYLRHEGCKFIEQLWHFNHVSQARQMQEDNADLYVSRTVATAGISMAWKLGARRIFLLGVDGHKLSRRSKKTGKMEDVYYHDGSSKGKERRKFKEVKLDSDTVKVIQDRHEWWVKNMKELRDYFDKRKLYPGPWPGPGIYTLNKISTIEPWQKLKVKTVLGKGCFKE